MWLCVGPEKSGTTFFFSTLNSQILKLELKKLSISWPPVPSVLINCIETFRTFIYRIKVLFLYTDLFLFFLFLFYFILFYFIFLHSFSAFTVFLYILCFLAFFFLFPHFVPFLVFSYFHLHFCKFCAFTSRPYVILCGTWGLDFMS